MNRINFQVQGVMLAILAMLFIPSVSWATTYFVTPNGSDTNAGTSGEPWRTIQKAADTMLPGDKVIVHGGTYDERVRITKSGTANSPIDYQAQGTVLMHGFTLIANYVRIRGFDIRNAHTNSPDGIGIYIEGQHNVMENNTVHDLFWEGIWLFGGPSRDSAKTSGNIVRKNVIFRVRQAGILVEGVNNIIEDNDISHTIQHPPGAPTRRGADADGIRFFGSGHIIRRNFIHDILPTDAGNIDPHIDCFQTWGPAVNMTFEQNICQGDPTEFQIAMIENVDGTVGDLTFRNNVFDGATRGINLSVKAGTTLTNLAVVNNTFSNLDEQAVLLSNTQNAKVQNNLFYDVNDQHGTYLALKDSASTNLQVSHNARYGTKGALGGSPYPDDLWQQDPEVVHAAGKDFHLQPTSPLIDAGITLKEVTNDYDDIFRPQGASSDIGAFEFSVNPHVAPDPPTNLSVTPP